MKQAEKKIRRPAPVIFHVASFLFLVCPPLVSGYVPLRRAFGDPEFILLLWPLTLLAWAPIFLWMLCEAKRKDVFLAALFPALSIFLLWSSGKLAAALFSGLFLLLGIGLNE